MREGPDMREPLASSGDHLSFCMVGEGLLEGALDEQLEISYGESKRI